MNILYIWDADYPWDVRVEKICKTLQEHGYSVHIAARNLKKLDVYEKQQGLHIHRLWPWKNDKINFVISFPAFFSPVWKRFLDDIIRRHAIEMIIVRDLPMAIAGIWAGKRHNIPVVFDMAEDYVSMIKAIWKKRKYEGFNLVIRNPYFAKYVERYTFKNINHVLVVIDEAKDVVVKAGGNPNDITIVSNTPNIDMFDNESIEFNKDIHLIKNRVSMIYTGGIQMGRGIQTIIKAIPHIIKAIPEILFVVVGDGYASVRLKELVREMNIDDYVLWTGWINHRNMYNYIRASKVGVIPHIPSDQVNTTIPNKIFDYMGFGIPILASNAVPIRRILEEEKCGLIYTSTNPEEISVKLCEVIQKSIMFGENGRKAIHRYYNWNTDARRLISAINNIRSH